MDEAETAVWDKIQEIAVRFQQADRIVLGVPMWNFAYPYKLKQLKGEERIARGQEEAKKLAADF
jgi:hypothetical protein